MVKFGERLPSLMQRGWEQYYLNYDAAKRLIESGTLTKTMSSEFYASIEKDLKKIDAFVQRRCGELRKAFKAAFIACLVKESKAFCAFFSFFEKGCIF